MDVNHVKVGRLHISFVGFLGFLVFQFQFSTLESATVYTDHINAGETSFSYMTYIDYEGQCLKSLNGTFSLLLNATFANASATNGSVYLSIRHNPSKVIVWVANRDSPGRSASELSFPKSGNVHFGDNTTTLWSSNTTGYNVTKMQLLENGNLVLLDINNKTVWKSFEHPSDTLLTEQVIGLQSTTKLVSSISDTNMSSGPYSLSFSESGELKLFFSGIGDTTVPYWSMAMDNRIVSQSAGTPTQAVLNSSALEIRDKEGMLISEILLTGSGTLTRATLGTDGNLRIYIFSDNGWALKFTSLEDSCKLPLFCGYLGVCSNNGQQCSCPISLQPIDKTDSRQGCQAPSPVSCYKGSYTASLYLDDITDNGLDYFATDYASSSNTSDLISCKQLCASNCSCNYGLFYKNSSRCFLFSKLGTLMTTSSTGAALFAKSDVNTSGNNSPSFLLPLIIAGSILVILALTGAFIYWYFKVQKVDIPDECDLEDDPFLDNIPGLPNRFSFKDLQMATNNFSKKLGTGGFGTVYEGDLPDNSKIAVKQLENIGQGKKEFQSEVTIIGSIHHFHLVQLRGFCSEGLHRLLVYEFMSNGSLDKCLFVDGNSKQVLDWSTRCRIALGTARGLAYLHNDCRNKVIHCDIKPENILLDDSFNAKVSDFGLAKLIDKEKSQIFTTMRGTRGYLAPEWLMNLPISDRSDVYSFGMVLLEIISGRKNYEPSETSAEKRYFPAYAFQQLEDGSFEGLVDEKIKDIPSKQDVIRMVKVALWCIQEETLLRPSMAKVVQMLEGDAKIDDPPSSEMVMRYNARIVEMSSSSDMTSSTSESSSQYLLSSIKYSAIQLSTAR